jgi:hypothetical protein
MIECWASCKVHWCRSLSCGTCAGCTSIYQSFAQRLLAHIIPSGLDISLNESERWTVFQWNVDSPDSLRPLARRGLPVTQTGLIARNSGITMPRITLLFSFISQITRPLAQISRLVGMERPAVAGCLSIVRNDFPYFSRERQMS